jgi:hypothetical protein
LHTAGAVLLPFAFANEVSETDMSPQNTASDLHMDPSTLYREETFTDQRIGTIRRLTPVDSEGRDDPERTVLYVGQAQLMTPMGAIPLVFDIPADSLAAAVDGFPAAAEEAIERTARELEEARRQAASSIVIPQGGGGLPGGGLPGGGFQLP